MGYGDYPPTNDASRVCASVYMIVGVTIALAALVVIGSNYISRREDVIIKRYERSKARMEYVSHLEEGRTLAMTMTEPESASPGGLT